MTWIELDIALGLACWHLPVSIVPDPLKPGLQHSTSSHLQVFTSRDSPRTICLVIVAKCVCKMHFHANWNR